MRHVSNVMTYREWWLTVKEAAVVSRVNESTDIIELKSAVSIFGLVKKEIRLRLIRTKFYDKNSKSFVLVFCLDSSRSR